MTNKGWIGAALFVLVTVGALIIWTQVIDSGGDEPVSAQEVVERAALTQTELLDQVGPDTTVHVVLTEYDPSKADLEPGPRVNPVHIRQEWWAYFNAAGEFAAFRSETRNADTGELIRFGEWIDGEMVTTETRYGETDRFPYKWSLESLRDALIDATNLTATKVVARAGEMPDSASVDGEAVYVIEEVRAGGVERYYIEKRNFRPVKYEIVEGETVVQSGTMPLFEIVSGNTVPESS